MSKLPEIFKAKVVEGLSYEQIILILVQHEISFQSIPMAAETGGMNGRPFEQLIKVEKANKKKLKDIIGNASSIDELHGEGYRAFFEVEDMSKVLGEFVVKDGKIVGRTFIWYVESLDTSCWKYN